MNNYLHSIKLVTEKCIGCTDCIKRCPTEAIRVRNGKAAIISERCIDCGMCVKICSHRAKKAITDPLLDIQKYKYKVAIPAPTLYAQFRRTQDINTILTAILKLGFDNVFEVARAASMVTEKSSEMIKKGNLKKPVISSACPAICELIRIRFPSLIDNIMPIISPMEVTAIAARKYLMEDLGIPDEDIGIFFISPCGAKATNVRKPLEVKESAVNGVISIQDVYMKLRTIIKSIDKPEILAQSNSLGIDWAATGGEGRGLAIENAISVDGVENVIKVFEELENGQLEDVDFIEGLACVGGCIGGALTIKNSFVAKNLLTKAIRNSMNYDESQFRQINFPSADINFNFTKEILPAPVLKLDVDMGAAIKKMEEITKIYGSLPHIDCGSCGAPNCQALAEDIVRGNANIEDCVFMLRQKVIELADSMANLAEKLSPSSS